MQIQPNLIVWAHSPGWCSVVQRNFSNTNLSWALDSGSLETLAFNNPGSAAIVEIPPTKVYEFCRNLVHLTNNSIQLRIFAIGSADLLQWQPLLRISGFSAWYWSLMQTPELVRAVSKHLSNVRLPGQSVESRVWSSLPWPTAATDQPA